MRSSILQEGRITSSGQNLKRVLSTSCLYTFRAAMFQACFHIVYQSNDSLFPLLQCFSFELERFQIRLQLLALGNHPYQALTKNDLRSQEASSITVFYSDKGSIFPSFQKLELTQKFSPGPHNLGHIFSFDADVMNYSYIFVMIVQTLSKHCIYND